MILNLYSSWRIADVVVVHPMIFYLIKFWYNVTFYITHFWNYKLSG